MADTSYFTVAKEADASFEEKKSKFISYVKPVKTAEEANAFIASVKSKHWDARHNVYAYRLREGNTERFSDDGEPQGTAGIPVLDVLQKSNVTDLCVVVTRYFGGILLGTGGLVRAYSHSASIGLAAARIVQMVPVSICTLSCDYSFYGRVPAFLAAWEGELLNTEFSETVNLQFSLPTEQLPAARKELTELSSGKLAFSVESETYRGVPA